MKYFDQVMTKKRLLSVFVVFFMLGLGLFFASSQRNAYAVNEFCTPDKTLFMKLGDAFTALDIRKTVTNMMFSAATDGTFYAVSGRNSTQMMGCSQWLFKNKGIYPELQAEIADKCPGEEGDPSCADLIQTYDGNTANPEGALPGARAFNQTKISGSLIGLANYAQGAGMTEPVPVNLAYFWNDSISKIPFAGSALAADVQYGNAPFIGFILEFWKITRNLSYGILSIIMLFVGVSIMMRKKLSPQLVVTAQYALPRIALAVILITFSYPIGAVLASSMKYLLALSNGLIYDVAQSALAGTTAGGGAVTGVIGIGAFAAVMLALVLASTGVGAIIVILTIVFIAAGILLYLFVWVKAFMLYIKLILSIIFAPFAFALGAVPGNESSSEKWIKSAISSVLGYVGSIAYAHMILVIAFIAVAKGFSASTLSPGAFGSILVVIFFPVFTIYGFIQATKVPAKINTMIMGEEKRPGGKR